MTELRSINHQQRLYVLNCGEGYTCLGFDVAERWRRGYLEWLGHPIGPEIVKGTPEAYQAYVVARALVFSRYNATKKRCPAQLTKALMGLERRHVEGTTPSGEVDKFYVGKSTGWIPIHLALTKKRDDGGFAAYVPDGSKVRVLN